MMVMVGRTAEDRQENERERGMTHSKGSVYRRQAKVRPRSLQEGPFVHGEATLSV